MYRHLSNTSFRHEYILDLQVSLSNDIGLFREALLGLNSIFATCLLTWDHCFLYYLRVFFLFNVYQVNYHFLVWKQWSISYSSNETQSS